MNIAVNARLLLKGRMEGLGWFSYETLKRITKAHPEHTFYFIFDRPYAAEFIFGPNVVPIVIGPQSRHPVLWYIWFQLRIPQVLKSIKADIFLSPDGYMPLHSRVPCLPVIHDIAYEHYPQTVPRLVLKYYRYFFPRFARQAKRIATVSEFSKEDISKFYHIPPAHISVVYNGCHEAFHPIDANAKLATRMKWSAGAPYFIFVGGLYPRKNLMRLMQAFMAYRQRTASKVKLLITGRPAYKAGELLDQWNTSAYKGDIVFTGRIDDMEELNALIASSLAMAYVSVFEGFGIPCLEAMRCQTAVIASATSSLPEVCGEAARYVDPFSIEDISAALEDIATNDKLRQELIEKGIGQERKFSWDRTAQLLWQAIKETV